MAESEPYDTKTLRFHLPDRGQYLYVMLTRLGLPESDTEDEHLLGEIGYHGEYIQFQTMSLNKQTRLADTDLYNLARRHPFALTELYPFDLLYALDTGKVSWDAISDGDRLTEADVDELLQEGDSDE